MGDNKDYLPYIDISKLLCAILVVFIHFRSQLYGSSIGSMIVACFSNQAVPFFMIVSGFFWSRKINNATNKSDIIRITIKVCFNYLMIYIVWSILWLPSLLNTYKYIYPNSSILYFIFVLIRRFFIGGQGVYWYLLVLSESLFVASVLIRYNKDKLLYIIGAIGLVLGLIYELNINSFGLHYINQITYLIFGWNNNVFMKGLPYIAIGYYCHKNYGKAIIKQKAGIITYVLSSLIMISMYYLNNYAGSLVLYPLQAISLFVIACKPATKNISIKFSKLCRNLSSSIYYLHTVFKYGLASILFNYISSGYIQIFVAIMLSIGVYCIVKRFNIRPLMWLLSVK